MIGTGAARVLLVKRAASFWPTPLSYLFPLLKKVGSLVPPPSIVAPSRSVAIDSQEKTKNSRRALLYPPPLREGPGPHVSSSPLLITSYSALALPQKYFTGVSLSLHEAIPITATATPPHQG
ncbi:hypothetical protein NHX12_027849 [Muraenolepis orangiensis]|uniref:Uncharacterized protein n=1 Tax=Muraenolepis orangiensis TaxID=630683 RepID=A0A9Q0EEI7_9TELE|nr:hypothetical protein NHX12_027849 [Muraenolepis orangiensis]